MYYCLWIRIGKKWLNALSIHLTKCVCIQYLALVLLYSHGEMAFIMLGGFCFFNPRLHFIFSTSHTHTHTHTLTYIYIYIYKKFVKKSSYPHWERRAIAEHSCYGNALLLLIKLEKLIQISFLTSVQVRLIHICEVSYKSKIWEKLRTFWTNPLMYI